MLTYETLLSDCLAASLGKPRTPILVVEDDLGLKMIFEWVIRDLNPLLTFHWCTSFEQAEEAMKKNQYQLIISDFLLEGFGNGLDVLGLSSEILPKAKFVMMSSLRLQDFCRLPEKNEPLLLSKPVNIKKLQDVIRDAICPKEAS